MKNTHSHDGSLFKNMVCKWNGLCKEGLWNEFFLVENEEYAQSWWKFVKKMVCEMNVFLVREGW